MENANVNLAYLILKLLKFVVNAIILGKFTLSFHIFTALKLSLIVAMAKKIVIV